MRRSQHVRETSVEERHGFAEVLPNVGGVGGHFGRDRAPPGAPDVIVGIISDTHGLLRPEAIMALDGAERIVHAGDIGSPAILDRLAEIAPVVAVRGNNDRATWAASLPDVVVTDIAGARVCVVHDLEELRVDPVQEGIDIIVSGHSHRPGIARRGHVIFLNPGSAGPRRFTLPIALARLRLDPTGPRAEIIELDVAEPGARKNRRIRPVL